MLQLRLVKVLMENSWKRMFCLTCNQERNFHGAVVGAAGAGNAEMFS